MEDTLEDIIDTMISTEEFENLPKRVPNLILNDDEIELVLKAQDESSLYHSVIKIMDYRNLSLISNSLHLYCLCLNNIKSKLRTKILETEFSILGHKLLSLILILI